MSGSGTLLFLSASSLPAGYKAIDIGGFFGQQHINVVCYEISEKDLVSEFAVIGPKLPFPADLCPATCACQMATGKAQHYNAHKRYLLTLELKHVQCMSAAELEEADREEPAGDGAEAAVSEPEEHDLSEDDSEVSEASTTTDLEGDLADDMDEESIAIAREMTEDRDHFPEEDHEEGILGGGLAHVPDESELIPGSAVVSLIAIPAPWEPWEQRSHEEQQMRQRQRQHSSALFKGQEGEGGSDTDSYGRIPSLSRSEGSRITHGNAITHENSG